MRSRTSQDSKIKIHGPIAKILGSKDSKAKTENQKRTQSQKYIVKNEDLGSENHDTGSASQDSENKAHDSDSDSQYAFSDNYNTKPYG